ncbi:MAG: response regulator [Thermodesulfobacteriota bacterium]|nr:response regulator [Thermodesulfobacteriota bacterium]
MTSIVVVDEEQSHRPLLVEEMSNAGYEVTTAGEGELAKALLNLRQPAMVFVNPDMNGKESFELLEKLRRDDADIAFVVTAPSHMANDDWLSKPDGYFV